MSIDAAITIYIIELEIPPQFLLHLPTENKAEGSHIFHEVNISILWEDEKQMVTRTNGGSYGSGAVLSDSSLASQLKEREKQMAQRLGLRKEL